MALIGPLGGIVKVAVMIASPDCISIHLVVDGSELFMNIVFKY